MTTPQHLRACELCSHSTHDLAGSLHCERLNLDCETARDWRTQCGPEARFLDIGTGYPEPLTVGEPRPSVATFPVPANAAAGPVSILFRKDRS